jgi:hypothetical protein
MGFAYKASCYDTQAEAAAIACGNEFPMEYANGSTLYVASCSGVNASGSYLLTRTANGASPTAITVPSAFPTCDFNTYPSNPANLSLADGGLIAAAVAGAWMTAWAIKAVVQVLKDSTHDSAD